MQGGDEEFFDAEAGFERGERKHEANRTAVGVGDDVAAGSLAGGLLLDEGEVVGVDFGDDERDVGGHAEGGGVGDDGAAGGGEEGLELAGDGSVDGGEDDAGKFGAASSGVLGWRTMLAMRAGRGVSRRQAQASA